MATPHCVPICNLVVPYGLQVVFFAQSSSGVSQPTELCSRCISCRHAHLFCEHREKQSTFCLELSAPIKPFLKHRRIPLIFQQRKANYDIDRIAFWGSCGASVGQTKKGLRSISVNP